MFGVLIALGDSPSPQPMEPTILKKGHKELLENFPDVAFWCFFLMWAVGSC